MGVKIEAVLFDLGGVLVELGSFQTMFGPSRLEPAEITEYWLMSDLVRRHERGECSVDEFAEQLHGELGLTGTAPEFIERFMAMPKGLFPEATQVVDSVAHLTTALLSNTNAAHWGRQGHADRIALLCDRQYLSFELGMIKPDREIHDHVIADLGIEAEQILFLDDNQINVDGALGAGMSSALAKGPAQAADVLRRFGVTG